MKGYLGDRGNDLADILASKGDLEGLNLDISDKQKIDIKYNIRF